MNSEERLNYVNYVTEQYLNFEQKPNSGDKITIHYHETDKATYVEYINRQQKKFFCFLLLFD